MKFLSKRKRKKLIVQEHLIADIPRVIKESKIKPTRCEVCQSIYQAEWKHIKCDMDIAYINGHLIYTRCPVCNCANRVEFEEVTTDGD